MWPLIAPAPWRQQRASAAGAADLGGNLARQLQHVAVEQEEAGEAEPGDDLQLFAKPCGGLVA